MTMDIGNLLDAVFIVPLLGMFFVFLAKDKEKGSNRNMLHVGIFTVISNLFLLWLVANNLEVSNPGWQLVEKFSWLSSPSIDFVFGIDWFSLLLITAVHVAVLLGMIGIRDNTYRQKSLLAFSLLFLNMSTGFFLATDLFSFYIYFEAMLLPMFMLAGIFGDIKKYKVIYRFFIYNLLGAALLFMAVVVLYNYGNMGIKEVSRVILTQNIALYVWVAIFVGFLSRIPVWPFHYWISSINASISNPLVFIIANIFPLTGVYGLIRFFPVNAPEVLAPYVLALQILSVVTMVLISLIGFVNKDVQYKLFSYITVYYIFFLLGAMLPTDALLFSIGHSLFSFIIIVAAIVVLTSYVEHMRECHAIEACGILYNTRRVSFVMSFLVLAGVGLPLSSMFLNNLMIFGALFKFNIKMTIFILFAVVLSGVTLLYQLFFWKYPKYEVTDATKVVCAPDVSNNILVLMLGVMTILLASLVNPLWWRL